VDARGLDLIDTPDGCRIPLRVKPAARQDMVVGPHAGRLKLTVSAPPERGRANQAVERLLATILNVATSRVRVVAGETVRDKVVLIAGCTAGEVRRRIEAGPRISEGPGRQ